MSLDSENETLSKIFQKGREREEFIIIGDGIPRPNPLYRSFPDFQRTAYEKVIRFYREDEENKIEEVRITWSKYSEPMYDLYAIAPSKPILKYLMALHEDEEFEFNGNTYIGLGFGLLSYKQSDKKFTSWDWVGKNESRKHRSYLGEEGMRPTLTPTKQQADFLFEDSEELEDDDSETDGDENNTGLIEQPILEDSEQSVLTSQNQENSYLYRQDEEDTYPFTLRIITGVAGSGKTTLALDKLSRDVLISGEAKEDNKMLGIVPTVSLKPYLDSLLPNRGLQHCMTFESISDLRNRLKFQVLNINENLPSSVDLLASQKWLDTIEASLIEGVKDCWLTYWKEEYKKMNIALSSERMELSKICNLDELKTHVDKWSTLSFEEKQIVRKEEEAEVLKAYNEYDKNGSQDFIEKINKIKEQYTVLSLFSNPLESLDIHWLKAHYKKMKSQYELGGLELSEEEKKKFIRFNESDVDALLYLYGCLRIFSSSLSPMQQYSHIFIDEFQDFSVVQLGFIKHLVKPEGYLMMVGDYLQTLHIGNLQAKRVPAHIHFNENKRQGHYLASISKAFRYHFLDDKTEGLIYEQDTSSPEPIIIRDEEIAPYVLKYFQENPTAKVAVMCPTLRYASAMYYGGLEQSLRDDGINPQFIASRIQLELNTFQCWVSEPKYLKGIEFDCVFVVGIDKFDLTTELAKNTLYVALSRPRFHLFLHWNNDLVDEKLRRILERDEEILSCENTGLKSFDTFSNINEVPKFGVESLVKVGDVSFPLMGIEAGTFMMGALPNDKDAYHNEIPRRVTLTKSFWMGKYPCTQELYKAVMGKNPSHFKGSTKPVEIVSWCDAVSFCNKLSEMEGLEPVYVLPEPFENDDDWSKKVTWKKNANGYRLPTEAEWEYCARAGQSFKYSGSNNIDEVGWYDYNSDKIHPVGQKKANGFGLYDMSGNIWEWGWDSYYREYGSSTIDPAYIDASGPVRVRRGGSWFIDARRSRVSYRGSGNASSRGIDLGFRFLRSP